MLAPSTYTCPPSSWTILQISLQGSDSWSASGPHPLCAGRGLLDGVLKDAIGGGVGDHDAGQVVSVLFNGLLPRPQPHPPIPVSVQVHHCQPSHGGAGWVGPMGILGNESHLGGGAWGRGVEQEQEGVVGDRSYLTLGLPYALQVGADGTQPSVLALGPAVGLEAYLVIAGDLTQVPLQLL